MASETSAGQKQLVSNSSFELSTLSLSLATSSSSMATTQGLWKAGGRADTVTQKSTMYSDGSTISHTLYPDILKSTRHTFPVDPTLQTLHQEVSLVPSSFYSLPSIFLNPFTTSSSMPQNPPLPPSSGFCEKDITPQLPRKTSTKPSSSKKPTNVPMPFIRKKTKTSNNQERVHLTPLLLSSSPPLLLSSSPPLLSSSSPSLFSWLSSCS